MREKLKKIFSKKEYIVFLVALIITLASLSYAFFLSSDMFNNNIATTDCFKLTFNDSNDIHLEKTYPLSENEGSNLTPYQFTIKNVCKVSADYQVNIETLNTSTLDTEYLRIKLDNNESSILKRYELNTNNVNNNVLEGRNITTGTLRADEERTYNLRMWIDENATVQQSANKEYYGKVTVQATPNKEVNDIEIAYIVDGVPQDAPPAKGTGYKFKSAECENADGIWNKDLWGLTVYNMTGRAKCNIEFEIATDIEVNIYSAPVDEIYYYDGSEKVILGTTDTTGKIVAELAPNDDITLYSSVAKDPNNLSNDYSKLFTTEDETTDIYLMPDDTLYWYGYEDAKFSPKTMISSVTDNTKTYTKNIHNYEYQTTNTTSGISIVQTISDSIDVTNFSKLITVMQTVDCSYDEDMMMTPGVITAVAYNSDWSVYNHTTPNSTAYVKLWNARGYNTTNEIKLHEMNIDTIYGNHNVGIGSSGKSTMQFFAIFFE